MRLLLLSSKTKATPLLSRLHQERIYYDLLHSVAFIGQSPFSKRIYNGVLIDQELLENSSPDDLVTLDLLRKVLPCRNILTQLDPSECTELTDFFASCRQFPPRSVRQQLRIDLNLSVQVATGADFVNPQRTTTHNLSTNGCFLASPLGSKIGEKIWLNLEDLEDDSPLLGEVRWFSPASDVARPPGMGIKFLQASADQIVQLEWLMRRGMDL